MTLNLIYQKYHSKWIDFEAHTVNSGVKRPWIMSKNVFFWRENLYKFSVLEIGGQKPIGFYFAYGFKSHKTANVKVLY